jgi:uridine kinase
MLVIGLVGEKGGGKGTAVRLIAEALPPGTRCVGVRFSDLLRETLTLWHLPHTRANLQNLSRAMDAEFGSGTLAHAMGHRIATMQADVVILDGVRWEADRLLIRSFANNLLIYITANTRVRYDRLCARKENAKEHETSFAQFLEEEQATSERAISAIGATADVRIANEGALDGYVAQVRRCVAEHIQPRFVIGHRVPAVRDPSPAGSG